MLSLSHRAIGDANCGNHLTFPYSQLTPILVGSPAKGKRNEPNTRIGPRMHNAEPDSPTGAPTAITGEFLIFRDDVNVALTVPIFSGGFTIEIFGTLSGL